ncbi:hypothetical protein HHI36_005531, partial [Cryptolaemus montrouzieri]
MSSTQRNNTLCSNNVHILQWNASSLVANKPTFSNFAEKARVDIALISETWFKNNTMTKKGGVDILVRYDIVFQKLALQYTPPGVSAAAIEIQTKPKKFLNLISIYVNPRLNISCTAWDRFLSHIPTPYTIGEDFNDHFYWSEEFLNSLAPPSINHPFKMSNDRNNPNDFPLKPFTLLEML